jgi:carbamoyltransferase
MTMPGKRSFNLTEKRDRGRARKNALVVAAVLSALGAWNVYRHRLPLAEALGGLALLLCGVALFLPSWAERFSRGWMALAGALGYVNSRILLSLVYYLAVAPFGVVARLAGHDPLGRRASRRESYWIPRQSPRQVKSGFERSF